LPEQSRFFQALCGAANDDRDDDDDDDSGTDILLTESILWVTDHPSAGHVIDHAASRFLPVTDSVSASPVSLLYVHTKRSAGLFQFRSAADVLTPHPRFTFD